MPAAEATPPGPLVQAAIPDRKGHAEIRFFPGSEEQDSGPATDTTHLRRTGRKSGRKFQASCGKDLTADQFERRVDDCRNDT
jgi:hypothetical protein